MKLISTYRNDWEFLTDMKNWTWPRHGMWPLVNPNVEWWGFGPFELLRTKTKIRWTWPPTQDRGLA